MNTPSLDWLTALVDLLGEPGGPGAQLTVTDPEGRDVYAAPLARHHRVEAHPGGVTLWVRPVDGGHQPPGRRAGEPDYVFSLSAARRRGLDITDVAAEAGPPPALRLELATGQHATITTASPHHQAELARWDTFVGVVLPADTERALDDLTEDSWHGPYA